MKRSKLPVPPKRRIGRKHSPADRNRPIPCEEGCGCKVLPGHGFLAAIDGVVYHFCCVDCADSYQENLQTEAARVIRERVGPGMRVADVGCGSGFYTAELADRVGPDGQVFAVDSSATNVGRTEEYLTRRGLRNRVTTLTAPTGSLTAIPSGGLDFLLSSDALCCTSERSTAFREIARVLRPGAVAYLRVSEDSPRSVRPLSTRERELRIAPFERLAGGHGAGSRWAILRNPPATGP
ncbi:MAG: methyltransferase domain-containing protein [Thermoplasmata archaeon]|nr:methyltransferase domain-containing protein [Thermoplasmata archaeon]